jgi:hypothetical protein
MAIICEYHVTVFHLMLMMRNYLVKIKLSAT